MKKIILILILGLLATGVALAHTDEEIGIGATFSFGGGSHHFLISPGLSLKLPDVPVFWGIFVNFNPVRGLWGLGMTGDRHFFEGNFRDEVLTDAEGYTYHLRINWYAGLGGFANLLFGGADDSPDITFGVRIPVGLRWHAVRWGEVALGIVPSFGMYGGYGGPAFHWSVAGEIALRYWFTPQARRRARENRNGEPVQEIQAVEPLVETLYENGGNGNGYETDNDSENGEYA